MKEASGELSMTLIVIIAAGVILGIFMIFKEPITTAIKNTWNGFFDEAENDVQIELD